MTSFGPFRLDVLNQRLHYGSLETPLSRKAAAILECLIKRPNELVTHDELLDSVWTGVHVQPEVLKVYIAELRRALGDSADQPRYIETVHRRGYRYVFQPSQEAGPPKLTRAVDETIVGRAGELACLFKLMRKAAGGQRQLAFITGEAGIGKTALLNTFVHRVERRPGIRTALGQVARAQGENEPFSPILDALARLMSGDRGEALVAAFRKNAPGWLLQFPSLLDPEDRARLSRELMGATSQRMIREFVEALDSCCLDSLLILGLDDIHRADLPTLDLLEYFASRSGPARVLIIAASGDAAGSDRVRSLIGRLQARQLSEEIRLDVLSEHSVREFLDARYPPSDVGSALAGRLHRLSGGVPLFLCSAARYVEEKQWILKTGQGWIPCTETVRLEDLIPPVMKELVELRVRQLSLQDQRILEAASIAGLEFPLNSVAHALDEPAEPVEEACSRIAKQGGWLQPAGFTLLAGGQVSPKFRFLHELFREVLYGRQSPAERVRRHRGVALALERTFTNQADVSAQELALHFAAGQERSKSLQYLRAAARNAQLRYSGPEAAALLTQALSLSNHVSRMTRPGTELEMLCELGVAYFSYGDFEKAAMAWHKALGKAVKVGRVDLAVSAMSWLAFPVGWDNPARLRSASDRVLAHANDIDDPVARSAVTIRALALCDIAGSSKSDHAAIAAESLRLVVDGGDQVEIASARIAYSFLRLRHSEYEGVIEDLERSLPIALDHNVIDVVRAEWSLSWALLHTGQWGRMQSVVVAAAEHARKNGNVRIEALFLTQLAWLHVECGAYQSAQNLCLQVFELCGKSSRDLSRGLGLAMCHVIAGMAAIGLEDIPAAVDHVERASVPHLPPEHFWRVMADINALRVQLMKQNHSEAQRKARRLFQTCSTMTEKTWKAVALSVCAQAAAGSDQGKLARKYLDEALQLVDGADLPLAKWRVEAIAAEVLSSEYGQEAGHFMERSRNSSKKLFSSLSVQDPLRSGVRVALNHK